MLPLVSTTAPFAESNVRATVPCRRLPQHNYRMLSAHMGSRTYCQVHQLRIWTYINAGPRQDNEPHRTSAKSCTVHRFKKVLPRQSSNPWRRRRRRYQLSAKGMISYGSPVSFHIYTQTRLCMPRVSYFPSR
jgi:hypothetical protein